MQTVTSTEAGDGPFGPGYLFERSADSTDLLSLGALVDQGKCVSYEQEDDVFVLHDVDLSTIGGMADEMLVFSRQGQGRNMYTCELQLEQASGALRVATSRPLQRAYKSHTGKDSIAERRSAFTAAELVRADKAHQLMRSMGDISPGRLINLLSRGQRGIESYGVGVQDVVAAVQIYGESLARLKGRRQVPKSPAIERELRQATTVAELEMLADIMFIDERMFLVAHMRPLGLFSAVRIPNKSAQQIAKAIGVIKREVEQYGPEIVLMRFDMEGGAIGDEARELCARMRSAGGRPMRVEPASGTHVSEVERDIRTCKEIFRGKWFSCSYRLCNELVNGLVQYCVYWMRCLPRTNDQAGLSPWTKLTGKPLAKSDIFFFSSP
jgi:hypothetical protein